MIPLFEMDERQGLLTMRDVGAVLDLARCASVRIPEASDAAVPLIQAYKESPLARFHQFFYSRDQQPPEAWPQTYDRLNPGELPPCVSTILECPNDRLLKPAGLKHLVRALLASA